MVILDSGRHPGNLPGNDPWMIQHLELTPVPLDTHSVAFSETLPVIKTRYWAGKLAPRALLAVAPVLGLHTNVPAWISAPWTIAMGFQEGADLPESTVTQLEVSFLPTL